MRWVTQAIHVITLQSESIRDAISGHISLSELKYALEKDPVLCSIEYIYKCSIYQKLSLITNYEQCLLVLPNLRSDWSNKTSTEKMDLLIDELKYRVFTSLFLAVKLHDDHYFPISKIFQ